MTKKAPPKLSRRAFQRAGLTAAAAAAMPRAMGAFAVGAPAQEALDQAEARRAELVDLLAALVALRSHSGEKVVVLVTHGEENCDGEPARAVKLLRDEGVNVNIVGVAIDDEAVRAKFRDWAELGGGRYVDAPDLERLKESLTRPAPFDVYDPNDQVVAQGVVGGAPVEVRAGVYRVRVRTEPVRTINGVEIRPGEATTATLE